MNFLYNTEGKSFIASCLILNVTPALCCIILNQAITVQKKLAHYIQHSMSKNLCDTPKCLTCSDCDVNIMHSNIIHQICIFSIIVLTTFSQGRWGNIHLFLWSSKFLNQVGQTGKMGNKDTPTITRKHEVCII